MLGVDLHKVSGIAARGEAAVQVGLRDVEVVQWKGGGKDGRGEPVKFIIF
jgi:hypothetical protein